MHWTVRVTFSGDIHFYMKGIFFFLPDAKILLNIPVQELAIRIKSLMLVQGLYYAGKATRKSG